MFQEMLDRMTKRRFARSLIYSVSPSSRPKNCSADAPAPLVAQLHSPNQTAAAAGEEDGKVKTVTRSHRRSAPTTCRAGSGKKFKKCCGA